MKYNKKTLTIISAIASATIVFFIIFETFFNWDSGYKVITEFESGNNARVEYNIYEEDKLLKCSRDGISLFDMDGKKLWSHGFNISNPIIEIKGKYILVGDMDGNSVYLFNDEGLVTQKTTSYPIISLALNENGFFAVAQDDQDRHYFDILFSDGETLAHKKSVFVKDGFPLNMAMSQSGIHFVTSHVNTVGSSPETIISFHEFGNVGEQKKDNFLGAKIQDNSIMPFVEFIEEDKIVAIGNDVLQIYNMEPELIFDKKIDDDIKSVFMIEKYIGLIVENNYNKKEIQLYNYGGKEVKSIELDVEYDNVEIGNNQIALHNEWEVEVYNTRGKINWKHTFDSAVNQIIPVSKNKYIIVFREECKLVQVR